MDSNILENVIHSHRRRIYTATPNWQLLLKSDNFHLPLMIMSKHVKLYVLNIYVLVFIVVIINSCKEIISEFAGIYYTHRIYQIKSDNICVTELLNI